MGEQRANYDVAIVGGGLAGLTLALQLHQESPGLAIAVLERSHAGRALYALSLVGQVVPPKAGSPAAGPDAGLR